MRVRGWPDVADMGLWATEMGKPHRMTDQVRGEVSANTDGPAKSIDTSTGPEVCGSRRVWSSTALAATKSELGSKWASLFWLLAGQLLS